LIIWLLLVAVEAVNQTMILVVAVAVLLEVCSQGLILF
jgi:hypothetical protein